MRALIVFQVNGADGKFQDGDLAFPGAQEHIHFVFKALPFCFGKIFLYQRPGHAAQPGLGIGYVDAA